MERIKAIFLAANPSITTRLALDEEIRTITEKVRAAEHRNALDIISAWAVRPDDLLQTLNVHQPQIVHFSGHGSPAGEIILVNTDRTPKPISSQALKFLFTTLKDNIRVIVLNACYSRLQAEAIAEVVDCVIGMNDTIKDQAAILFAASFYRALCFGRSVQEAFDQGRAALLLEGIAEDCTPELLTRTGVDPASMILIGPQDAGKHPLSDTSPAPSQQDTATSSEQVPEALTPLPSEAETREQTRLLKALADPTRLRILSLLARHEDDVCVFQVMENFTLEAQTISHHLRILRDAGLIDCRKKGLWAYYYVHRDKLNQARDLIDGLA